MSKPDAKSTVSAGGSAAGAAIPPPAALGRQISDLASSGSLTGLERAVAKDLLASKKLTIPATASASESTELIKAAVAARLLRELECESEQSLELEALKEIFSSTELVITNAAPHRIVSIVLLLDGVEWSVTLTFTLPLLYPLDEPVKVKAYVSHPLIQTSDEKLGMRLTEKSIELSAGGGASIYAIVEDAREWMASALQSIDHKTAVDLSRLDDTDESEARKRIKIPFTVLSPLLGVETTSLVQLHAKQSGLVKAVVSRCADRKIAVTDGHAKSLLRQNLWNVENAVTAATAATAKLPSAAGAKASATTPASAGDAKADPTLLYRFDCLICMDKFEKREGICVSGACNHWCCADCWSAYLHSQIKDGGSVIRCPALKCAVMVEDAIVQSSVDHDMYRRYQRWMANSYLLLAGWHACRNEKCDHLSRVARTLSELKLPESKKEKAAKAAAKAAGGGIDRKSAASGASSAGTAADGTATATATATAAADGEGGPILNSYAIVSCECGSNYCVEKGCESAGPHWPASCGEVKRFTPLLEASIAKDERQKKLDEADRKAGKTPNGPAAAEHCKACPKCGFLWGKTDGCYQMICLQCKQVFCWECGQKWEPKHTSHFDCPNPKVEFTIVDFSRMDKLDGKDAARRQAMEQPLVERVKIYKKHSFSIRQFLAANPLKPAAALFAAAAKRGGVDATQLRRLFDLLLEGYHLLTFTRIHVHVISETKYVSFVKKMNPVYRASAGLECVLTILKDSWDAFASKSKLPTAEMVNDLPTDISTLEKRVRKLACVVIKLKLKALLKSKS